MILSLLIAALLQVLPLPPEQAEARLVSWSIADFQAHPPGRLRDFRAVHVGQIRHPEGVDRPVLCGEVQVDAAGGGRELIRFATLETRSGYEQWLGGSSDPWCKGNTTLDKSRDLSPRFESALVASDAASR
jgi:hypothetical protein